MPCERDWWPAASSAAFPTHPHLLGALGRLLPPPPLLPTQAQRPHTQTHPFLALVWGPQPLLLAPHFGEVGPFPSPSAGVGAGAWDGCCPSLPGRCLRAEGPPCPPSGLGLEGEGHSFIYITRERTISKH